MTAPELDLTAATEAALAESYRPRKDPGYSFLNRASYDNLWGPHVEAMVEAALPHIREALAQQCATGRIVAAEFSDGIKRTLMGCEDCECQLHDDPPRPAGIYATIRFDDDRTRVGIMRRVSMVELGGES